VNVAGGVLPRRADVLPSGADDRLALPVGGRRSCRKCDTSSCSFATDVVGSVSRTCRGTPRIGTTAFAIARWPPALPISPKKRRTNSPAFFEYPRFLTETTNESLTIPPMTVHLTFSSCRKKSAV
jgi:hypothetical protein